MKTFKFKLENTNILLKKMAAKPFPVFCCLLLISAVISSGFFLYCEAVLIGNGVDEGSALQVKAFNSAFAKKVFDIWNKREQDYKDADSISYPNLFKDIIID
jgi:hypothetical protein